MRHGGGIVKRVCIRQDRIGERALCPLPQAPEFLEPGDVPDLPQRRIDDRELRSEQPIALEVGGDADGPCPRVEQVAFQHCGLG